MITKAMKFIKNRFFLKYFLIFLTILIVGAIFLLQSKRNKNAESQQKTKDNAVEIKSIIDKADLYFDDDNRELAILTYNKAIKLCDPEINTTDYVYSLYCIADLHYSSSDYISSEIAATKALPYLKLIKNPRYSWLIYNVQGQNYLSTYDFTNAELYFKKALRLKTSLWRKRVALNNIAATYKNKNEYDKAIEIYQILASNVHASKHKHLDDSNYAFVLDNMGYCYYKKGNNDEALKCYYKALEIRLHPKSSEGLVNSYRHLSTYFQKKDPQLAKKYATEALKTATKMKSVTEIVLSLSVAIESNEGNELKKHIEKYIHLTDSIAKAGKMSKNQFFTMRYESKVDKEQNLQLKAEKTENELQLERHKNRNIISYIIIVFIIGFFVILVFYLSLKGKKEKKEAVFESEKRISRKLHNKLALQVYNTLSYVKETDLETVENKNKLLNNLEKIYSQTRTISRENSIIETNEKYESGLKEMISGFKTSQISILTNGLNDINWTKIDRNKKIIVYRILQELFQIMKSSSNVSLVIVSFKIIQKNITVTYSDNRVETENEKTILKNTLQNVENRIKTINGTINFDHNLEKGFKINFTFPL
ncbi:tetratricopeptide repeat-containing sensor histidine kinase [Flavobacterium sp. 2]|uniref:ATP-binding protein n=1 Tax=Flavobacterium sp. 2 TaxID=308053 RepID=UPI000C1A26C1|nr:tetratricopeptide repeat-containing sensor histidine kinase [Flavobacterium sp. 2]